MVVRETFTVTATHKNDLRPAVYLAGEPDVEVARAKANDLWSSPDIVSVELYSETLTRLAGKRREPT